MFRIQTLYRGLVVHFHQIRERNRDLWLKKLDIDPDISESIQTYGALRIRLYYIREDFLKFLLECFVCLV